MARAFGIHKIIGGFEDALHPDSARLSVAVGRNSKACGNLLKAFVEIHNSLRSDNGFLLITQLPANQEFLLCLHMKPGWNQLVGLDVVMKWIPMIAERYLI